jgi:uncharacterized protein (DUF2267 family)
MVLNFQKDAMKGELFIKELAAQLNHEKDLQKVVRILKSTLHGFRNHLSVNESLQLIAQFPMFLKAIYVDSWTVNLKKNKIKKLSDFIDEIRAIDVAAEKDFPSYEEAENTIITVFIVLRKYISLGELEDIKANLPKEMKSLLSHNVFI